MGIEELHGEVKYLVCDNAVCLSACWVDSVFENLSCIILLPRSKFFRIWETSSTSLRTVLLLNNYLGETVENWVVLGLLLSLKGMLQNW